MKAISAAGLALVFAVGCGTTRWPLLKGPEKPEPTGSLPSTDDLVKYLNENGRRMESVKVELLELDCYQKGESIGLRGTMMAEKPRSFRLNGNVAGTQVVDLGSNDNEFWFWFKKSNQFYCSYKDLNEGRVKAMPLPIQPEWLMETLGMGPYAGKYTMEHDAAQIRLVEKSVSPQGQPVRKVIVFSRKPVMPPAPQVVQYLLLDDATGKEICSATVIDVQLDKKSGAILPRRIELRYPEQEVKMAMRLDRVTLNTPAPPTVFVRQPLAGITSIDLARIDPGLLGGPPPKR